jgi:hypothetical protein
MNLSINFAGENRLSLSCLYLPTYEPSINPARENRLSLSCLYHPIDELSFNFAGDNRLRSTVKFLNSDPPYGYFREHFLAAQRPELSRLRASTVSPIVRQLCQQGMVEKRSGSNL